MNYLAFADNSWEAPIGMAAWLGCLSFILFAFNQSAKAWRNLKGRDPEPSNASIGLMVTDLGRRVTTLEDNYAEMQADRVRKWDELQREISAVAENVAYIRGCWKQERKDR